MRPLPVRLSLSHESKNGTIYSEMTNKGRRSTKLVRGVKPIYCFRWVAEISVDGKRHRFRSTNYANCRAWLDDMINKAAPIPIVAGAAAYK